MWFPQAPGSSSSLYARRTTYADRNSPAYLRDFSTAVDSGLASARDDIVWVLIATILQEDTYKQVGGALRAVIAYTISA